MAALTASAQSFSDYYKVTCKGETVANGGTVYSSDTDYDPNGEPTETCFIIPVTITPVGDVSNSTLTYRGVYTDNPSYEAWLETCELIYGSPVSLEYGQPQICYEIVGGGGQCPPANGAIFSAKTFDNETRAIILECEAAGSFMLYDPDTNSIPMPVKDALYKVELTASVNGKALDAFNFYFYIGPTAAGVDNVAVDFDAPVEYFDLTGRRIQNPAKGQLIIERKGSKVVKRFAN